MKGTGKKESDIISVSPDYKINVVSTSINNTNSQIPVSFELFQNYPNPFNPSTLIRFQLSAFSHVQLKIFDLLGREVATLFDESKPLGNYEVLFDGKNLTGGVYFYKLIAGNFIQTKKMLLLK